jgi:ABC-type cobalamin/Fe3+-siderophores transport system ATPase subunit
MPVGRLSGGQRQLLATAMVLQKTTRLLLLDEPTAALDLENAHHVLSVLCDIAEKESFIVMAIIHDQALLAQYASRIYIHKISVGAKGISQVSSGDV